MESKLGERIVCAMSGGVDSSVAAALLLEQGFEVIGLFMKNGISVTEEEARKKSCCSADDAQDARRVAARLGIPFYALDFTDGFERIIQSFVDDYATGRTPNPCIQCNRHLKFGRLMQFAASLDAETVATGHYARRTEGPCGARLLAGRDRVKDQSYQLFSLTRRQLEAARFPLGDLEKPEVRERARDLGLVVAEKTDSQEICFVPSNDYRELLRERAPEALRPGRFVDRSGRELGQHGGTPLFTIGQRHGLGVALGKPAYVVELRPETGEVVLGDREDLLGRELECSRVNWLGEGDPESPFAARVKIRSRHDSAAATVTPIGRQRARVVFDEPVSAITPGQAAVFYRDDEVLGGGWIEGEIGPSR
ncbi:MAG: tRNA 2-thiouridine(34) synthase MnmA [Planctomycetota bacterium]